MPSSNLQEGRKAFAASLNQELGNPKFTVDEVRRIGERDWIVFEFIESRSGVPTNNIFIVCLYKQRAVIFSFTIPSKEFPRVEPLFRAAIASITIKS